MFFVYIHSSGRSRLPIVISKDDNQCHPLPPHLNNDQCLKSLVNPVPSRWKGENRSNRVDKSFKYRVKIGQLFFLMSIITTFYTRGEREACKGIRLLKFHRKMLYMSCLR